jgi:hypothetical protein
MRFGAPGDGGPTGSTYGCTPALFESIYSSMYILLDAVPLALLNVMYALTFVVIALVGVHVKLYVALLDVGVIVVDTASRPSFGLEPSHQPKVTAADGPDPWNCACAVYD